VRRLHDISAPLGPDTEPWPGDTPVSLHKRARIADGDAVDLGTLTTSLHNGTHADAPCHVRRDGATADALPLAPFFGPAVVLDAPGVFEAGPAELSRLVPRGTRVLLRAGRPDARRFPNRIVAVPPEWIEGLARRDVPLLGTDQPSVDPADSRELPAHQACLDHGIQIVENLVLEDVSSGPWELAALPLRVEGGDAAPLRAVLWQRDSTKERDTGP
jgi:arylformamidase